MYLALHIQPNLSYRQHLMVYTNLVLSALVVDSHISRHRKVPNTSHSFPSLAMLFWRFLLPLLLP